MKKLMILSFLAAMPVLAQTDAITPTPAPVVTTEADRVATDATTEVKKAGSIVKDALNKAAKKIEKKLEKKPTPAADNTPKGEAQSETTTP